MKLVEFLEDVNAQTTVSGVWDSSVKTLETYGFDRFLYGFTHSRTANSFGDRDDILILSNHCSEYIDPFLNEGMYFHAPMVKWAAENVGSCSWGWVSKTENLTESEKKVFEFNKKFGITAGYSVSFKDISVRSRGAIGLVGPRDMRQGELDAIWENHGREVVQICNVMHLKITNLPHMNMTRKLTARQKEVLEWVGEGKTTQDIATIMGLTSATVEKHLRLAREVLGVDTTAQAVLKASYQNQIYVLEV